MANRTIEEIGDIARNHRSTLHKMHEYGCRMCDVLDTFDRVRHDAWMALTASSLELMPEDWEPVEYIGKIRYAMEMRANEDLLKKVTELKDRYDTLDAENYNNQIGGDGL